MPGASQVQDNCPEVPFLLVGCKADLRPAVAAVAAVRAEGKPRLLRVCTRARTFLLNRHPKPPQIAICKHSVLGPAPQADSAEEAEAWKAVLRLSLDGGGMMAVPLAGPEESHPCTRFSGHIVHASIVT